MVQFPGSTIDRLVHGRADGLAEPIPHVFRIVDRLGLAADQQEPIDPPAHQGRQPEDFHRVHVVALDQEASALGLGRATDLGLDEVERPGPPAARDRVDQDDRVIAVEQGVGQVEPPDAEVDDADPLRQGPASQPVDDLDAEGVVAQEDVADPGDEDARRAHGDSRRPMMSKVRCNSSFSRIVPPRAVTGLIR